VHELDATFHALERLHERGLIDVGRIEYADGGSQGALDRSDASPNRSPQCGSASKRRLRQRANPPTGSSRAGW
jgi:hypothetical protein